MTLLLAPPRRPRGAVRGAGGLTIALLLGQGGAFSHGSARYSLLVMGSARTSAPHNARTERRAYAEQALLRVIEVARTYDPDGVLQVGSFTRMIQHP